jgi:hypothetical protein
MSTGVTVPKSIGELIAELPDPMWKYFAVAATASGTVATSGYGIYAPLAAWRASGMPVSALLQKKGAGASLLEKVMADNNNTPVVEKGTMDLTTEPTTFNEWIKELVTAEQETGRSVFRVGKALATIATMKESWKELGSHVHTLEDVFRELGYGKSTGYNLIKIYTVYYPYVAQNPDYLRIPYSNLVKMLPIMHDADGEPVESGNAVTHLESALSLGTDNSITDYIRGIQGKEEMITCQHKEVQKFYKCKCCHKWVKSNE